MSYDTIFQMSASNIRFGAGATREIGEELKSLAVRRAMLVIDAALVDLPAGRAAIESLRAARIDFGQFDAIAIEPTDASFQAAAEFAAAGNFDAFVAIGGGSTIDTAKAANLYSTHPADFLDYVNAPVGLGKPPPAPLKPLIAVPTTAGTGSETTGVAIFDLLERKVKTGIAHRYLRPALGVIDPENTRTLPAAVAAAAGLDVLSHALESYTAIDYRRRPRLASPAQRPAYQGANPISDIWALRALEMVDQFLIRAVRDVADDEARGAMLLAAAMAGIGFGNAGVHLAHAVAYPVAGMVRGFVPPGYAVDDPLVPHGMSVILHTPAVCRFTSSASPRRHLAAAAALGAETAGAANDDAGEILAIRVIELMRALEMPNGLAAIGYNQADIPALVAGALPQQRLTKLSPVAAGEQELAQLFMQSMTIW